MSTPPLVAAERMSGFPEWLPEEKLIEERFLATIRRVFALFGFTPIETPAVERVEVLAAKGGNEKEIYALRRLAETSDSPVPAEMALHFDLTVPTARYVAQHFAKLVFPFRRYQMQKVWRGERPQAGRFREFYQCDIDVIGHPTLGLLHDAEMPAVIDQVFRELAVGEVCIRVSNRKILQGLLQHLGIDEARRAEVVRSVDRFDKVGAEAVTGDLLGKLGLTSLQVETLLQTLQATAGSEALDSDAALGWLRQQQHGALFDQGIEELATVMQGVAAFGVPAERCRIDLSIARGLDYYTGTVYETTLLAAPQLGSICSGGRYDNLAAHYTARALPGVGISIGLTRLLSQLFALGLVQPAASVAASVLITATQQPSTPASRQACIGMAQELRASGIAAELVLEDKALGAQLKYAARKGFAVAVLAGETEMSQGEVALKHLATATQRRCQRAQLVQQVAALLALPSDAATDVLSSKV